ncbi:MAG: MOP flippase family protein [Spirochaetes bacterium]|nr:MOP flippase family protein [Spirochaetota bacterium]
MKDNLKKSTINALSWSFIETIGMQTVQFIISIILARLLLPAQFGLIGMLTIFIAVSQTFLNSGFGSALIQKCDATQTDICSVFYFNIVVGIAFAALLCFAAPWIADFYKQPVLTPLTRLLSLVLVINSFGLIQTTIVTKEINFKILTKANIVSSIVSGIIGIVMALNGFGVWSLAIQQISRAFLSTLLLWIFNTWRPSAIFNLKSLSLLFTFGSRMLASGLLNQIFNNIYLLVIGKLFSASDLGYFTRASTLQDVPSQTLGSMVSRVTFPVFSTLQDDRERLKRVMKKALTSLSFINIPVMLGLSLVSRPLIIVLFGEKWSESIPYLQLLCFLGLLLPMHLINLNALEALGKSNLFFRLEVIKKILIVINIAITWRWGISAMIYGMIITSVISYYLNSYYSKKLLNYSIIEQIFDLLPYISVSLLMGVCVYLVSLLPFPNVWSLLLSQIIVGGAVYIGLCRLFKLTVFMEICREGLDRISFRKNFSN